MTIILVCITFVSFHGVTSLPKSPSVTLAVAGGPAPISRGRHDIGLSNHRVAAF